MSDAPVIDGEAVDVSDEPHEQDALVPTGGQTLAVTPQVKASELVERLAVIREAQENAMVANVDYGVIPGTDKPTLYKPGAEKLGVLFQLDVQLTNEKVWGPGEHLTVIAHATVFHAPTGTRLGYGEGVCTTRERKYGKRKQERVCPNCGMPAVIKGKAQYGGGWVCWKKRDGCDSKWSDGDPVIESQEVGEIENPDLPDLWNTVTKMAEKRARVDAVLAVTGASALFTQDVEDMQPASGDAPVPPAAQAGQTPTGATVASDAQKGRIRRDFKKHRLTKGQARALLAEAGVVNVADPDYAIDGLAKHQASAVIDALEQGALPDPDHPSDIPGDGSGFVHRPSGDTSDVPIEDAA